MRDTTTWTAIVRLLLSGGPFAVGRLVIAVIVDALQSVARWSLSHVVVERLERLTPTLADRDSTASIVDVSVPARIFATLFHGFPRVVFWRPVAAMFGVSDLVPFGAIAPAGHDRPSSQKNARDGFFSAAVASANPHRWVRFRDSREGNQAAKPLICEIDDRWRHACHSTSCGA